MNIYLFVYYVKDIEETKMFLSNLGLSFTKEKHGNGPVHYSTMVQDTVFEIYPSNENKGSTVARIGFDLTGQISGEQSAFIRENCSSGIQEMENGKNQAVIKDPSGNNIEVIW